MTLKSKRFAALLLTIIMIVSLASCGQTGTQNKASNDSHDVVLDLFASNYSVLAVSNLVDRFQTMSQYTAIRVTYDEPAMLAAKIEAGYDCDIFICEVPSCMDWLDGTKTGEANPNKNNLLNSDSRKQIFKGVPDGYTSDADLVYEIAVTKKADETEEIEKFIDFITSENADKAYEGSGFSRIQ